MTESPPPVETVDEPATEPEAAGVPEPQIVAAQLDALSDMDDAQAGVVVDLDVPSAIDLAAAEPQLPVVSGETAVNAQELLDPLTAPLEALTAHGVPLVDLPPME